MKKLALSFCVLVLLAFTLGASATPATTDATETEATPTETTPVEPTPTENALETQSQPNLCLVETAMFPGPNYCGDPCTEEGQTAGCIDTSGPFWKRVICTCVNGSLVC